MKKFLTMVLAVAVLCASITTGFAWAPSAVAGGTDPVELPDISLDDNEGGSTDPFYGEDDPLGGDDIVIGDLDGDGKVTDDDAILLLFHVFFPKQYVLNQPADFNGDGKVDDDDAIYLLFNSFFPEQYVLHH